MIHYIIYVSSAKELFTPDELLNLLSVAKKNNDAIDVTGMLLYKEGNFLQIIEGQRDNVKGLFKKIEKDPRHRNFIIIDEGQIEDRMFSDWKMGFRNLDEVSQFEAQKIEGYSTFMNNSGDLYDLKDDKNGALLLLNLFKDTL